MRAKKVAMKRAYMQPAKKMATFFPTNSDKYR